MSRTAVTQQHTHKIVMSRLVVVHRCDCLQILVQFYCQVLLIGSSNFNLSSQ